MLIQITNTCRMLCTHCLQRSDETPMHMSMNTVDLCVEHALACGVRAIMISGGEPTEHPDFKEIMKKFINFPLVCIISNGMWIDNLEMIKTMKWLMSNKNVFLQITNIKGLYPKKVDLYRIKCLFPTVAIEKDKLYMLSLGRATDYKSHMALAKQHPYTMSCMSSSVISAQMSYRNALAMLELRSKFCHPLIDWKGNIHWSESWLCPSFANVEEPFEEIARKANLWRPCGGCADYQKLLEKTDNQYVQAKRILGINYESATT